MLAPMSLQVRESINAGRPSRALLIVTKTLLISTDGNNLWASPAGAGGNLLRSIDKKTGKTPLEQLLLGGNCALGAVLPSPEKPAAPVTATVEMIRVLASTLDGNRKFA